LFHTPEIVDVIAGETNGYPKKILEIMPHLKLRSMIHHWKEMNRNCWHSFITSTSQETEQQELFYPKKNSRNTHIFGPFQGREVSPQISSFC
jgi:hypothetical protein